MLARSLYILFIVFETFFLNVVVPGHTRGQITIPGYAGSMPTCAMDCGMAGMAEPSAHHAQPTQGDKDHCAICQFAVGLCIPPPPIVAPTPWGNIISCRPLHAESADFKAHPLPWHGRAPPVETLFA